MQKSKLNAYIVIIFINLLLLAARCGPSPTPISQSTPVSSGVEVVNITEIKTFTNELTQQKIFDQCDSASPFKAQVQFSQSSSQESQQELVLGVTAGGEVGVSAVAKVKLEGAIQQHF